MRLFVGGDFALKWVESEWVIIGLNYLGFNRSIDEGISVGNTEPLKEVTPGIVIIWLYFGFESRLESLDHFRSLVQYLVGIGLPYRKMECITSMI
jgi:hypothetical protein